MISGVDCCQERTAVQEWRQLPLGQRISQKIKEKTSNMT